MLPRCWLPRKERAARAQPMSRPFPLPARPSSFNLPSYLCADEGDPPPCAVIPKRKRAMKEELESVVLQMYRAGMRCSEAVREFQKAFILTVLKDQRGNQRKAAEILGIHRNTLRRTIRELEIDIGPTRAMGRRRPPQSDLPMSVRRRAT
jgi:Fis family transcriptional regulator